jgi:hypothetical protein
MEHTVGRDRRPDVGRDAPLATSIVPGRHHHAAGMETLRCAVCFNFNRDDAIASPPDRQHMCVVAPRKLQHLAIPAQVIHPVRARHAIDCVPGISPEARHVVALDRQRRKPKLGADQKFGRAQRAHAGKGLPRALIARGVAVDAHDISDALAYEAMRDGQSGLPATDDQHVVDMRTAPMLARLDPWQGWVREHVKLVAGACRQGRQVVGSSWHYNNTPKFKT